MMGPALLDYNKLIMHNNYNYVDDDVDVDVDF